jgi:beta-galactosidase/beta-glucuronidase
MILSVVLSCHGQNEKISLAGKWNLCIDSLKKPQNIDLKSLDYNLAISLPSTLDSAGIGFPVTVEPELKRENMLHLQRKVTYIGPAYYQREVSIPKKWKGKNISLKLERVLWKSTVWIDGTKIGNNFSLCTPHYYDLSKYLAPGKHTITICIDNSRKFILGPNDMAHAYTEETQIKWNGILGEISLNAVAPSYISQLAVYPDFAGKSLKGEVKTILNIKDSYSLKVEVLDKNNQIVGSTNTSVTIDQTSFQVKFSGDLLPWDEFSPNLYTVKVSLLSKKKQTTAVRSETFGFRDLKAEGRHFSLNGKPLFLRGTLECSIFPLTGHPPLDEAGWEKVFGAAREYGLNHLRFHSWCPPDAAFRVADKMGMYLQVELPNWSLTFGKDQSMVNFINNEADNIIREYGNHPSFILWSMGNELEGDFSLLTGLVTRLKNKDPRHLYTTTTYSFQKGHGLQPETVDDFYITQNTEKGWVRGQGVFDQLSPDFKTDYTNSIDNITIPVVSHEIGQYSVFPDMKEIEKYKGVLSPVNFIAVKNDLEKKGLLSRAVEYTSATGKFGLILILRCYEKYPATLKRKKSRSFMP